MYLYFKEFRYNIEEQLLYKASELIPLKRNQAAMLDFFLSDMDSIHSKDDILNAVWGNQVVSEQVIFQTISQLRSVLGSDAIKTFSKKGYKWELAVLTEPAIVHSDNEITTTPSSIGAPTNPSFSVHRYTTVLCIALIAVITTFVAQHVKIGDDLIALNVLSKQQKEGHSNEQKLIEQAFSQNSQFDLINIESGFSVDQAFSAPKLAFQKLNIPANDWLMWGEVYSSAQYAIFHYGLSSKFAQMQGYVEADTIEQLPIAIVERFNQLLAMGFFSLKSHELELNGVRAMLNSAPDDPDLMLLAAKFHEHMEQDDVALSYLQKLIRLDSVPESSPYRATAHWKIGKIYKMRGQHLQAQNSLDAMAKVLEKTPVGPLHFHYIKTKVWLAYSETDHETMYKTLDEGFDYFEDSQMDQPLIKFKLHILNSILAQKVFDHEMKYYHLNQAQALLLKHKLDESNFSIVYYHFALFSLYEKGGAETGSSDATQDNYVIYLEKILELPRTIDNFWIQDEAIELLVKYHIEQKDYVAANDILADRSSTPKRQFLKAEILLAQNQYPQAIKLYEGAFERARIDYDTRTAIESALILYELFKNEPKVQAEYLAYLETNANTSWLREHLASAYSRLH